MYSEASDSDSFKQTLFIRISKGLEICRGVLIITASACKP